MKISLNGEEALYVQLRDQIIMALATGELQEGDALPSVRQLAEIVGINMHTANKAYNVLKQEGFLRLDRRRGASIAVDKNKEKALENLNLNLTIPLASALCKGVSEEEVHQIVSKIYGEMKK